MSDIELHELGERRIRSVLSEGVKPGSKLSRKQGRLLSLDGNPCRTVHGALINPRRFYTSSDYYEQNLNGALYFGGGAVFEVLMERPWDNRCLGANVDLTRIEKVELEQRAQQSFLVVCQFQLDQFLGAKMIPSAWFHHLIFPHPVYMEYEDVIADSSGAVPIRVVPELIEERILPFIPTFRLPDYETQLRELAEILGPTLWVHGVRLPTPEDL